MEEMAGDAHMSTRALRVEYLQPGHKEAIPDLLSLVESYVKEHLPDLSRVPLHRKEFCRFYRELFAHGELLPPLVFLEALQMGNSEMLNAVDMPFSPSALQARDQFVMAYKPVLPKLRQLISKEITALPEGVLRKLVIGWLNWEELWLRDREEHAVEALQPLAKAILSLTPFLESRKKEQLHPYPRVQAQRQISYRCLIGFIQSLGGLSAQCLSSLKRELSPDPRLFLLMDYILTQAEKNPEGWSCVRGMAETPDIYFVEGGSNIKLSAYAFRLVNQKGVINRAVELLTSFEKVKSVLLGCEDLLFLSPALDQNLQLTQALSEFEKTFKRCKKLYLEPDNLI